MYLAEKAPELFPGASFAVAHCNFGLRGEESDGDEAFVRGWCSEHGVECVVKRFDTRGYAAAGALSIEMAARELRYAWFAELCDGSAADRRAGAADGSGFEAVAVAHNADDNAETLLLNLVRGTGSRGLRGMSADVSDGRGVRILRPLLGVSRDEIHRWMVAGGHSWREDSSNASADYKRNRIRLEVLPVLKELNPSLLETLRSDMEHIAQVDDIAEEYFGNAAACGQMCSAGTEMATADLMALRHWKYVLWRWLEPYGFDSGTVGALTELLEKYADGRITFAGKTFEAPEWRAVTTADSILIRPRPSTVREVSPEAGGPYTKTPGKRVRSHPQKRDLTHCGSDLAISVFDKPEDFSPVVPEGTLVADADKLPQPLKIRAWQPGDWMVPLGMKGRKKLSDLFVDLKWNILQKETARVIEYPDGLEGHVAALLFCRIDDSLKITASTRRILRISSR